MVFYVLMVPSFAFLGYMAFQARKTRKHDEVLFRFCQIRRNAIELIASRHQELSKEQYSSVRRLLDHASIMIHDFDKCKSLIFNYRRFVKALKFYRGKVQEADQISVPNDADIVNLHKHYRYALWQAFLAYTPFIKTEFSIKMMIKLFALLSRLGNHKLQSALSYLTWAGERSKQMHNQNGWQHA